MDYAQMRADAVPVADVLRAMEGDWRARGSAAAIEDAEVIIGVDTAEDRHAVLYGRDLMERTVSRSPFMEPTDKILTVKLDFAGDELEFLCAAVQAVKGHHDYGK